MKIFSTFIAVCFALPLLAQVNLFERFDVLPIKGKFDNGAKIDPKGGMEKGALTARGNGKNYQYIYTCNFPAKAGEEYSITLNARTSGAGAGFFVMILWDVPKGKKALKPIYERVGSTGGNWSFKIFDFKVPEGAVGGRLCLRMANAAAKQQIWVDHLRLAAKSKLHMTDFETAFDDWQFNRHLIFDRFILRNTGTIVNEWKEAKVGEAFFKATGNGHRMQYPLFIENLTVTPGCSYIFRAFLKASASFRYPNNGMIIFFYKDANGKPVGQSRYHIRATEGEWKEFTHAFTVSPKAVKLDIGLNMRRMPAKEFIQLDHIRFQKSASNVACSVSVDPDKEELTFNNMISADIPQKNIQKLEYVLSDGRKIPAAYQTATVVSFKDFKDGTYTVEMLLTLTGNKVRKTPARTFMICRNPVWRNNLGVLKDTDTPPREWKKLRRQKNELETWNSRFVFSPQTVLSNIRETSSGQMLLKQPLLLKVNGTPVRGSALKWQDGAARTTVSGSCGGKNWQGQLSCKVDYTGFARFTLDVVSKGDFQLDSCDVELELADVEFLYRSDDSWTAIGAVDLKKKPAWETKTFYNELQFGNVDRGISVFIDKLYPARGKFDKSWVKVQNKNKMTIHTVVSPLKLAKDQKHRIEFGIQPYPYRPAEENWKKLRFRAGKYKNLELIWHTQGHYKYCGSTSIAAKPELLRQIISKKKGRILYYQFPFYIMDNIPEWSYFEKRWKGIPARAYDLRSKGGMAWKARLTDKDWQDFYLYHFVDHLKKFDWDGVYYDCFGSDVFIENGETFHPVYACREFQERIYIAQRLRNPDSLTVTHTGGSQSGSASAFANVILMGEQYRGPCVKYTYPLEFLTLDEFRYENAVNMGPDRMFLPQYRDQAKITSPKVASHILGLVLTHNLMLYPNFINKKVELSVRYRQYDFGMENSTFYPYWKKSGADLPGCTNAAVVSSCWKNPKGFLMAILNPTQKTQRFSLKVPKGYKVKYYFSPEIGKEVKADKFQLDGLMSALVCLEEE